MSSAGIDILRELTMFARFYPKLLTGIGALALGAAGFTLKEHMRNNQLELFVKLKDEENIRFQNLTREENIRFQNLMREDIASMRLKIDSLTGSQKSTQVSLEQFTSFLHRLEDDENRQFLRALVSKNMKEASFDDEKWVLQNLPRIMNIFRKELKDRDAPSDKEQK